MAHDYSDSVFDVLDNELHRLIDDGFRLDGRTIDTNLPQRVMTPLELKAVLLHPSTTFAIRDATWRYLIDHARRSDRWMTVALGMLQPGMRRAAGQLVRRTQALPEDLDSELVTGVVEAITVIDLDTPRLATRLISAGIDRARRVANLRDGIEHRRGNAELEAEIRHPETTLWRAVEAEVITAQEAELIASTRLDGETITDLAHRYGMTPGTLRRRRNRAETRLQTWIREIA